MEQEEARTRSPTRDPELRPRPPSVPPPHLGPHPPATPPPGYTADSQQRRREELQHQIEELQAQLHSMQAP